MNIEALKRESIQKAAALARGSCLSGLYTLCETNKTVSTAKLLEHVEKAHDILTGYAALMRDLINLVPEKSLAEPFGYLNPEFIKHENWLSVHVWKEKGDNGISMPVYAEPTAIKTDSNQWKPIETAPKDGTEVLLFSVFDTGLCYWSDEMKFWTWGLGKEFLNPSHWMPIPERPKANINSTTL